MRVGQTLSTHFITVPRKHTYKVTHTNAFLLTSVKSQLPLKRPSLMSLPLAVLTASLKLHHHPGSEHISFLSSSHFPLGCESVFKKSKGNYSFCSLPIHLSIPLHGSQKDPTQPKLCTSIKQITTLSTAECTTRSQSTLKLTCITKTLKVSYI